MEELNDNLKKEISSYDQEKLNKTDKKFGIQINIKKQRKIIQRTKPVINIPIFEINRQYYEELEKAYQKKMRSSQNSINNSQKKQLLNFNTNIIKEKNKVFELNTYNKSEKEKNNKLVLNEYDKLEKEENNNKMSIIREINGKEMSDISFNTDNEDNFSYAEIKDNFKFLDNESSLSSEQIHDSLNGNEVQKNNFINNDYYNQLLILSKMQLLNQIFFNNMSNNINLNQNLNMMNILNNNINFNIQQNSNDSNMMNFYNLLYNNQLNSLRNINNINNPVNLSFTQRTRMNDGNEGIIKVKYSSKLEKCNNFQIKKK